MTMRAIIVDDESPAREYLRVLLGRIGGIDVIGEAEDAESCMKLIASEQPDIAFLDIRLPGMDGIELAQIVGKMESAPRVVFVSGYDDYAVQAFDLAAADYLLKPFNQERLRRTIERLSNGNGNGNGMPAPAQNGNTPTPVSVVVGSKLSIKSEDGWKLVDVSDILYARTEGRKVLVQTDTDGYLSHYTICELEQKLGESGFFRANEGCLVNLRYVQEVVSYGPRTYELLLNDSKETYIPLSRSKAQKLRELLGLH